MANYDEQLGLHDDNVTIIDEGLDVVERIVALNPDSQYQNLPIASTIAPGIAQFDAEFFAVDGDGNVSLVKDLAEAADNAKEFADEADKSANDAAESANAAAESASQSAASATEAKSAQTFAEQAKQAAEAAQTAAEAAQEAAEEAENQAVSAAENSETSASAARTYSLVAESLAQQAGNSATSASGQAYQAAGSAQEAKSSEEAAAQSALAAQGYMEQAKEYAQKEYKIYDSLEDLPMPGDSAFIYLVPSNSGTSGDSYSEYLWISETNSYEYIGSVNDVDLSNYAQINGTYPNMTVGNAANATNAEKATQDGNGNVITSTYATKAENNAKYTKPASGIPESDLAQGVQDKLNEPGYTLPVASPSALGGVKPVAKTDDMTQQVGVDANGALFTAQGGSDFNPSGTYNNLTAGKAVADGNGNNIADTYATKASVEFMTNAEVDALFN